MLYVYGANWCPHCWKTRRFLEEHRIHYRFIDVERESPETIQKLIEVNGGDDWVVPTLEYHGKWRKGEVFHAEDLENHLKTWGVWPGTEKKGHA